MSGSRYLPGELRDQTLRALADVLGFDFWALDEVAKEDAARALVEALGLQISASGGLEDEIASNDYDEQIEELQDDLKAAEEKLADAEGTIVELREFREDACAMFDVKTTRKTATEEEIDRPIGDILDDLSDARQRLEDNVEAWVDAYWDLRCSAYHALGLDTRRDEKASLKAARESEASLEALQPKENPPPSEATDVLAEVLDERAQLIKALGLDLSATLEQVLERVEDLAQFSDGVGDAFQDLDLPQTADDVIARVKNSPPYETPNALTMAMLDERAQIVNALGLDLRSTREGTVRYVRELVEKCQALEAKLLMAWSNEAVKAQTDALDEIADLLGFDPNLKDIDAAQAVRNLIEKHEIAVAALRNKIEELVQIKTAGSGPLRGVL